LDPYNVCFRGLTAVSELKTEIFPVVVPVWIQASLYFGPLYLADISALVVKIQSRLGGKTHGGVKTQNSWIRKQRHKYRIEFNAFGENRRLLPYYLFVIKAACLVIEHQATIHLKLSIMK
jgi:hypothetical protein